jgi:trans-aconitate 2-methyltransferase
MSWNPAQYLQYEDARLRPALELLARIPLDAPASIVDLGCGAGNVAQRLAQRWPRARVIGVDGDAAMLDRARSATRGDARFEWIEADLAAFRAPHPVDLVFSNAALHWLGDHARLFPALAEELAEGGVLAVQMPDNFRAPSHRALFELAQQPRWRKRVGALVRKTPVAAAARYHEWLAPRARALDVWTTEYLQHLPARSDDEHPVVAWMRGSALVPFTAELQGEEGDAFVADYASCIESAYPRLADGSVLFPFRRLFVIAAR